jgi:hypothetical protein
MLNVATPGPGQETQMLFSRRNHQHAGGNRPSNTEFCHHHLLLHSKLFREADIRLALIDKSLLFETIPLKFVFDGTLK